MLRHLDRILGGLRALIWGRPAPVRKQVTPTWLEAGWADWEAQEGVSLEEWQRQRSARDKRRV